MLLLVNVFVVFVLKYVIMVIIKYIFIKEIKFSFVGLIMKKILLFYKKFNRYEKFLFFNFCFKDGKFDLFCDLEFLFIFDGNFIKFNN